MLSMVIQFQINVLNYEFEIMFLWCIDLAYFPGASQKIKIRNHLSLLPSYADLLKLKQQITTKV